MLCVWKLHHFGTKWLWKSDCEWKGKRKIRIFTTTTVTTTDWHTQSAKQEPSESYWMWHTMHKMLKLFSEWNKKRSIRTPYMLLPYIIVCTCCVGMKWKVATFFPTCPFLLLPFPFPPLLLLPSPHPFLTHSLTHFWVLSVLGVWLHALTEIYACLCCFQAKKNSKQPKKSGNRLWCCINWHTNHVPAYAIAAFGMDSYSQSCFNVSLSFARKLHAQECTQEYYMDLDLDLNASN